jgi:ubiquinone/menaquinone biosynthesis C-methylase UbiE
MSGVNSVNLTAAATAFDRVAHSYDDVFTRSVIGRAQRNQVWQRLLAAFQPGQRILELNCGTGEDARFLAQKGRSVVACDASSVMLEVAEGRGKLEAGSGGIEYRQLANEDLSVLLGQESFDGAFSNFSGLNCVADLQPVARNLAAGKAGRPRTDLRVEPGVRGGTGVVSFTAASGPGVPAVVGESGGASRWHDD